MAKRRNIYVTVRLSVAGHVTAAEARRELRTRVNELCCYQHDERHVRVARAWPVKEADLVT